MNKTWPTIKLGDILQRRKDSLSIQPLESYKRLTIRMNGRGIVLRDLAIGDEIGTKKQFTTRAGQLVLSKIDARNGAFGILPLECDGAIITGNFWAFDPDESRLDVRYLNYLTNTPLFVDFCIRASEGTTNRRYLQEPKFLAQQISLPPLDEQRGIVARIDELSAKIVEARALHNQATDQAAALINSELRTALQVLHKRFGSHHLGDLIQDAGYGTSIKCASERLQGSVPVLRIPNVASERINFGDMKFGMFSESELERVLLSPGDILIVRTNGSADLVGRCAVVPALNEPTAFASYMIRIRCDHETLLPEYVQLVLKHLRIDGHLFDFARTTAGQYNVSLGRLRAAEVPVPTVNEQRELIAAITGFESRINELSKIQAARAAELDALIPSILSKAFSGEL